MAKFKTRWINKETGKESTDPKCVWFTRDDVRADTEEEAHQLVEHYATLAGVDLSRSAVVVEKVDE